MFPCPVCHNTLERIMTRQGAVLRCPHGHGVLAPARLLRKQPASGPLLRQAWQALDDSSDNQGRECPHCTHTMALIAVPSSSGTTITLDVCPPCHVIWFDAGELEQTSRPDPLRPPKQRMIAVEKTRRFQKAAPSSSPNSGWKYIPGLLGLPVEMDKDQSSGFPPVTFIVFLLCAAVFILMALNSRDAESLIINYGFYGNNVLQNGGLNLFGSFFIHAGFFHIFSNMYFLVIFGNNVESHLGSLRYLLLILGAHLAGFILHAVLYPAGSIPLIGASAGVSGVIAYYAVTFPRARIGFLFLFIWWIRIPAIAAIIIYGLMQVLGSFSQVAGETMVSHLAHLGGLGVGLAAGIAIKHIKHRLHLQQPTEEKYA